MHVSGPIDFCLLFNAHPAVTRRCKSASHGTKVKHACSLCASYDHGAASNACNRA